MLGAGISGAAAGLVSRRAATTLAGACLEQGQECSVSEDACCTDLFCEPDSTTCQLLDSCQEEGELCEFDEDCCVGLVCLDAVCAVEAPSGADHATITIHKATCPTGVGSSIFTECHDNVLSGVDFSIDGFEIGSGVVTTDANGVATHTILEAAAEGDITVTEDAATLANYLGVYVYCAEEISGAVLIDGNAPGGQVTFNAKQDDDIICDWYNITAASAAPTPTPAAGGTTTLPNTGVAGDSDSSSALIGAAALGGAAALLIGKKLKEERSETKS